MYIRIVFLVSLILTQLRADVRPLRLFIEADIAVEYTAYDPPIHIVENRISNLEEVPEWYDSFIVTRDFFDLSYDQFRARVTDAYANIIGVGKDAFEESKQLYVVQDVQLEKASILSTKKILYENREFLFVEYFSGELLSEYKDRIDLGSTGVIVLERIEDKWMHQDGEQADWLEDIMEADRSTMEQILKEGKMVYPKNRQVVPFSSL